VTSETHSDRAVGPVSLSLTITHNLRRGVSYRMGRDLSNAEVLRVLEADVRAMVSHHADLGGWVDTLDRSTDMAWKPASSARTSPPAPPAPPAWESRAPQGGWGRKMSPAARAKMSAAKLRWWAAKKAALACET